MKQPEASIRKAADAHSRYLRPKELPDGLPHRTSSVWRFAQYALRCHGAIAADAAGPDRVDSTPTVAGPVRVLDGCAGRRAEPDAQAGKPESKIVFLTAAKSSARSQALVEASYPRRICAPYGHIRTEHREAVRARRTIRGGYICAFLDVNLAAVDE